MAAPVLPGVYRNIISISDPITRAGRYSWSIDTTFSDGPGPGGEQATMAAAVAGVVDQMFNVGFTTNPLNVYMHDQVPITGHQVETFELTGPNAPSAIEPFTIDANSGFNGLPAEVALCVTKRTAGRGRRFRGRLYFGSMHINLSSGAGGRPPSSIRNALADNFDGFFINDAPGAFRAVVSSSALDGAPATASAVTSFTVSDSWDSQRRRGFR